MTDSVRPHRRQSTRLRRPQDSPGKNTGVGCHFLFQCMKVKSESEVAQSCPTLSDPMDCSLPSSSVHGIFQARILEWGATAFSIVYVKPHLISHRISEWKSNPRSHKYDLHFKGGYTWGLKMKLFTWVLFVNWFWNQDQTSNSQSHALYSLH